jgi:DNA helicase-2/ATP-dependent DNA helicase PcrA
MEIETEGAVYINMAEILSGLNESQEQAVTAKDPHLLVVAGPGTGKTLTIVRRIVHLLEEGVSPEQVIAVTFTNRAAREMRERIEAVLQVQTGGMFIGTFHLLGLRIIRETLQEPMTICGRDEQIDLLKPIVGSRARAAREAAEAISRIKNFMERPDGEIGAIYEAYQTELKQRRACDFDDLILIPIELFQTNRIAGRYVSLPRHIIIDEYQDISPAQYRLVKCLAHEGSTLCAVGDSDQAIYAFRGADVQNFLNFREEFTDAATVVLKENYRSTKIIVDAAHGLIKNNSRRIEKELKTGREQGRTIRVFSVSDEKAEADAVLQEIEARMGGTSLHRLSSGDAPRDFSETTYSFADFAVLFRTNAQAKVLREAFEEWGIPCQVVGDRHPANRRALTEPLQALLEALPDGRDVGSLLKEAWEGKGFPGQEPGLLENLAVRYRYLAPRDAVREIINELSLLTTADAFDPRADAVALMTLHMAKGLEFRVVFVVGCEDGLLPFTLANDDVDTEEERRLFYVGMTRAKDELLLLHARKRFLYGQRLSGNPSAFIAEIPPELVCMESLPDKSGKQRRGEQTSLF